MTKWIQTWRQQSTDTDCDWPTYLQACHIIGQSHYHLVTTEWPVVSTTGLFHYSAGVKFCFFTDGGQETLLSPNKIMIQGDNKLRLVSGFGKGSYFIQILNV